LGEHYLIYGNINMPITKKMFDEQYERAVSQYTQLKDMGKTEQEIEETMAKEKYCMPVLSKLFHKSGKRITKKLKAEDLKLAKQNFTERQDSRKPIRQKEIEDAAWFHNLTHDLGKYVYHKLVKYVSWTDEDMKDYEHACKTLTRFIDNIQTLIEDSAKLQRLEDEKTLSEIEKCGYELVLDNALEQIKSLRQYNNILLGNMTPEGARRALYQITAAIITKTMLGSTTQTSAQTD
jgi:5S rRNA maturation endonuclease (ribonuclease M5)